MSDQTSVMHLPRRRWLRRGLASVSACGAPLPHTTPNVTPTGLCVQCWATSKEKKQPGTVGARPEWDGLVLVDGRQGNHGG